MSSVFGIYFVSSDYPGRHSERKQPICAAEAAAIEAAEAAAAQPAGAAATIQQPASINSAAAAGGSAAAGRSATASNSAAADGRVAAVGIAAAKQARSQYTEKDFVVKARAVFTEITKEPSQINRVQLHSIIKPFIAVLQASNVGGRYKGLLTKRGRQLNNQDNNPLSAEIIRDIHNACLGIMQYQTPKQVKTVFNQIKSVRLMENRNPEWQKKLSSEILKLKNIYIGSIFHLPMPMLKEEFNEKTELLTLQEYFLKDPVKLELMINEWDLSQYERDHMIFTILFQSKKLGKAHLSEAWNLIDVLLEKGANFSNSHLYNSELKDYLSGLATNLVKELKGRDSLTFYMEGVVLNDKHLERMIANGYDINASKGGQTFLQILEWHLNNNVKAESRQHHRELLMGTYECALDQGADLRDVMSQEKIAKVQESIQKGEVSQGQDGSDGIMKTKDGYLLPDGIEAWEFRLVQQMNKRTMDGNKIV